MMRAERTTAEQRTPSSPTQQKKSRRKSPAPSKYDPPAVKRKLREESVHTRKTAALILEVLAGVRTPTDAAAVLGVSVPRYYALEVRALEGLVKACRRRSKGPPRSLEREVKKLREEVERLERENARHQALLRLAQRATGLRAPERAPKADGAQKKRRKRRPTARALRAAAFLGETTTENVLQPAPTSEEHGEEARA